MPDGRIHLHARSHRQVAAVVTATLATLGIGLATASPASAAPGTNDIDAARARVDRLSQKADVAETRHDKARRKLSGSRTQMGKLTTQIERHTQVMDSLRTQMATSVVNEYGDGYASGPGASAPTEALSEGSKLLLSNVSLVSEDAGAQGEALATSNLQLQQLSQRRAAMRDQITMLAGVEKSLRKQERQIDARSASASATLDRLEERAARLAEQAAAARMARLGGPVVAYAKSQVGKAYVWGATGPSAFDCSGLTMMAWQQAGVSLPHNSTAQYSSGSRVSESELQPGDLVFYYSPISHVGIYIGNGQVANALNPGSGVQISGLHDMPYVGAVRPG